MTLWRQDWNNRRVLRSLAGSAAAAACLALALGGTPALAQATTERIVVNRVSGYAISGYDPVAYFVEGAPVSGDAKYEFVYDRAIWRFSNDGNRNAFSHNPEVYEPMFGGYDPIAIAHGKVVAGRPQFWAVVDSHLLLFSSDQNRTLLLQEPRDPLRQAAQRWPELRHDLAE